MTRVLFLLLLAGCPGADTDTDMDTDSDLSTDVDTDSQVDADTDSDVDTDSDIDTDTSDVTVVAAVIGERCDPHDQVGEFRIEIQGTNVNASGAIYDALPAIPDTPVLTADGCSYFTFDPNICGRCTDGNICMPDGECAPRRESIETSTVMVTVNGTETTLPNNNGWFYGSNLGTSTDAFSVDLEWPGYAVSLDSVVPPANVFNLQASASGTWNAPGVVSMTWDVGTGEGEVFTDIPMNHHINIPAFTRCRASVSAGTMTASAPMIDPLAQSTGLEFQGFKIETPAAAQTAGGCVQFTVGRSSFTSVDYPNESF